MNLADKIKEIIEDQGYEYTEKIRTIYTTCPSCGRSDKFSILKQNGACICYHGNCDFGKGWFQDWLSLTAGIPIKEAKEKIYGSHIKNRDIIIIDNGKKKDEPLEKTEWPVKGFLPIDDPDAVDGSMYIENRGIPTELAKYYDIRYSPWFRRVVLPIKMHGDVYGWQARAIDKVKPEDRMRNNTGFRRDSMIMFHDNLYLHKSALLFEGPFDALKFHSFGGIICSMGKWISDKQVALINNSPVETVYLGLDPDAAEDLQGLVKRIEKNIKILTIPDSCIYRCKQNDKKADFGECTYMEIKESFESAKDFSAGHVFVYLKDPFSGGIK